MSAGRDAARHSEELLRLLNEILAVLKDDNMILKEHNAVVNSIDERVRKIGFNTSTSLPIDKVKCDPERFYFNSWTVSPSR